ncbi:MAG TPA: hypothetical protein VLK58_18380 [Conexibacter sp.]|nr:hypothetical protein [Conexibacter sp.]
MLLASGSVAGMRPITLATVATICAAALLAIGSAGSVAKPKPARGYGDVHVRQAGGADEPVIATFKRARCNRFGGGFFASATSPNGRYRMTVDISETLWKGYGAPYPLPRAAGQFVSRVVVRAPGGTVYDSTVPVPGAPGGGAVVFAPKGAAISVGGVFFLQGDTEVGIAVSGAMPCVFRKR